MKRQRKKTSMFAAKEKSASARNKRSVSPAAHDDQHTKRIPVQEASSKSMNSSGRTKKIAKTKKTKKKQHLFLRKLRTAFFMVIFVCIIVSAGIAVGMYAAVAREMQDMDIKNLSLNYSSFIYCTDRLGNSHELEQLYDDGNRIWLEPDEIPDIMKNAIVAIEDERFYKHAGVDVKRTIGAMVYWTMEKLGGKKAPYGGSTITQQVIKNITHEDERSPVRKAKEMMRAIVLERELSKDEVLTLYLNLVFFANNCYGVEAASNMYFDKDAIDLDYIEAATIAGITQRPSYFDPLRNPENTITKRNVVLSKMLEFNMITQAEYDEAVDQDLGLSANYKEKRSKIYSYFVDQVINDVISDLQTQKGYSDTFAYQQVYNGGLKIYTTMDQDVQNDMESVFENNANFPSSAKNAQASMVVIDPITGEIKGMIGGKGKKTDSRGLNRATQTKRQPGSALKPISVYAPALELKKITSATILDDEKITIGNWTPKNSYTGYKGEMPLRRALEISANIPAVKTLQQIGVDISFTYLKNRFHISTLDNADKALSPLGLGGLTYGVTVKELAAAYGVLANGGQYTKPHTYTKVIDNTGKLLLENRPETETVISAETAYILTELLKSVVGGTNGTGKLAKLDNFKPAGKTGTTNNDNDKWFVGYTPYYVGAVWYGFDTPASIRNAGVTSNVSAKLWGSVMNKLHASLSAKDFSKPSTVVEAVICTKTGKLASTNCGYGSKEYFISGTQPTKYCGRKHGSGAKDGDSPTQKPTTGEKEDEIQDQNKGTSGANNSAPSPSSTASNSNHAGDNVIEIPDEEITVIPD